MFTNDAVCFSAKLSGQPHAHRLAHLQVTAAHKKLRMDSPAMTGAFSVPPNTPIGTCP